jgi:hypothetical protein
MNKKELPFALDKTWSDFGHVGMSLDSDTGKYLEGQIFEHLDDKHGTGRMSQYIVLKNRSGGALTVARKLLAFGTNALDLWRRVSGYNSVAGAIVVAMSDEYTVGDEIPENDLFWGKIEGPCYLLKGAGTIARGAALQSAADAKVEAAEAGNFIVGTLDAASDEAETVVAHLAGELAKSLSAGS